MNMPTAGFDSAVIEFLNHFARESYRLDTLLSFISGNHLVKGGLLLALFWWAWFRVEDDSPQRARLGATLAACLLAMGLARLLAAALPFRLRPIHNPDFAFLPPFGMQRSVLDGWSAFPSDHAVLFYALSTGLLCVSRKIGLFALVYTTALIAMPRVYLGLHYPTDIIAGALLGASIVLCLQQQVSLRLIGQPVQRWSNHNQALFYPLLFLLSYQIADMFNSSRAFFDLATTLVKG